MIRSLNLRWKLLISLIGLSVLPLAASLLIVSGAAERQMEQDQSERVELISGLIERNSRFAQREKGNYIRLLADNSQIANAVHFAQLLESTMQLEREFTSFSDLFNFDQMEVLDENGTVLWSRHDTEDENPSDEHPVVQASLEGSAAERFSLFSGRLSIVAAAPVPYNGEIIGHLVGITWVDEKFLLQTFGGDLQAQHMALAFYGPQGVVAATRDIDGLDVAAVLSGEQKEVRFAGVPYTVFSRPLEVEGHGMLIFLDRSGLIGASERFRQMLVLILLTVTGLAIAIGLAISRGIARPLAEVGGNLQEIAEGEGDLTRELRVKAQGEIGDLAHSFNRFLTRMREMVRRTRTVSADLVSATEKIHQASRQVNEGATRQTRSLEECHQAMQEMEASISGIAESTGALLDGSEVSSSATLELGATIEEIASQMEKLFGIVEEVTSAISEMSVTSQQIAENTEVLAASAETTASSILEMDASIKEVEENADQTNRLSEEAAQDALAGKEAVEETIRGIGEIQEMVDRAARAIGDLGQQSKSIGKILVVIDEVADQTSLLALNAAIIAAQSGEHGRGFAVVADEIRELADRTATSTREITAIISNLQGGTEEAVRAMTAGSARVHQEVERSRSAGAALEKIRASTLKSAQQVRGIVRATQEQSRGSQQITGAINQVSAMLGQISAAVRQQSEGSRQLTRAAEVMKEIASQGKIGTGEQAKGSRQISVSMEQIRTMIERIDEATRALNQRSREVLEAVAKVRHVAEENAAGTAELDQVVKILSSQTAALKDEVGAFTA